MKFCSFLVESSKDLELTKLEDVDEDVLKYVVSERDMKLRFFGRTVKQLVGRNITERPMLVLYDPLHQMLHVVFTTAQTWKRRSQAAETATTSRHCHVRRFSKDYMNGHLGETPSIVRETVKKLEAEKL